MKIISTEVESKICLVHLVRQCNGIDVFKNFIVAYKKYKTGLPHTLLFVFKGYEEDRTISEYRNFLIGVEYRELFVADQGFDIGSYMEAFQLNREEFEYFCFLNSYSEPLHDSWLELLFRPMAMPGVGVVGATGSWQSISSDCDYKAFTYTRSFLTFRKLILRIILPIYRLRFLPFFSRFPNAHVRTNAFLIRTDILDRVIVKQLQDKIDAYRFESGRNGLTRQIQEMNLRPIIAGADGKAYEVSNWPASNVFRRNEQENLLVADNQTNAYLKGDLDLKVRYSFYAWRIDAYPDDSML